MENTVRAAMGTGDTMGAFGMTGARSVSAPSHPLDEPHLHTWELRAVEFDTWGQVSYYECLDCPGVRYL
jgi:hypothetical protein